MADSIYLAGMYSRKNELALHAESWLDSHDEEAGSSVESRALWATEDMADLMAADTVVAFTEAQASPLSGRGGRHVEFGAALAAGKRLIVVGHRENVFHCLQQVEFCLSWQDAFNLLTRRAADETP